MTREIRGRILEGTFPSHTRLDQQMLAREMGVSIIPVREGLRHLQAEGLVRIVPRRGAFVAGLSPTELSQISWMRERLEDLAVRLASPRLDSAGLDQLAALNDRMAQMTARARPAQWFEMNRAWHFALYGAGDSPLLAQMITLLWDRSELYRLSNAAREDNRVKSVEEHAAVIRHLRSGNVPAAARAIRHHIRRAARDMLPGEVTDGESQVAG